MEGCVSVGGGTGEEGRRGRGRGRGEGQEMEKCLTKSDITYTN